LNSTHPWAVVASHQKARADNSGYPLQDSKRISGLQDHATSPKLSEDTQAKIIANFHYFLKKRKETPTSAYAASDEAREMEKVFLRGSEESGETTLSFGWVTESDNGEGDKENMEVCEERCASSQETKVLIQ
jgi:hypothetical protein